MTVTAQLLRDIDSQITEFREYMALKVWGVDGRRVRR